MSETRHNCGKEGKTRRDFIKTVAAGAMAGSYAGLSSKAKAQEMVITNKIAPSGANEKVIMGWIGVGGMGSAHLASFLNFIEEGSENVHVAALCDVAKPRLDSNLEAVHKRQKGPCEGYMDYRKVLDNKDIDCVLIATPEHWHAQMTIDALKAGKDVYVEKPMTLRLDDALRLYREEPRSKNFVQVGTQYMTYPNIQVARKLIAEGAIGHPTLSQDSYCRNSRDGEWLYGIDKRIVPGPNLDWDAWCGPLGKIHFDTEYYHRWRRYRRFSTGIIGDLLVHKMTPLMWALDAGWPIRVTATGGHYIDKAMENHDQVNLTIQFEKEHTMIVAGSTCNENGFERLIRGHEANMFLGWSDIVIRPERTFAEEVDEVQEKFEKHDSHNAIRHDFLDCVRTRKPPISPVSHATKVMVIVDLATRSMWEGKAFAFDPVTMTARAI